MTSSILRTALFVDFDNLFLSFQETDRTAADQFGKRPGEWLRWFEAGEHDRELEGVERRVLVRRCYGNPDTLRRYRGFYTRAGFNVIDCPKLTGSGKNAADIYMVIDLLDLLSHKSGFDEFIIMSGDADFTPVVLRLREHDRRTAVVVNAHAAAAYKSAADSMVEIDRFLSSALGLGAPDEEEERDQLARAARFLSERLKDVGEITDRELPILIMNEFPAFRDSEWFGLGTRERFKEKMTSLEPSIARVSPPGGKLMIVRAKDEPAGVGPQPELDLPTVAARPVEKVADDALRQTVLAKVREILGHTDRPILMSALGQALRSDPDIGTERPGDDWGGHGTLKALIVSADEPDVRVRPDSSGTMFVYDPAVHGDDTFATASLSRRLGVEDPEMAAVIDEVNEATNIPGLSPKEYAGLFTAMEDARADYGGTSIANTNEFSLRVRDLCNERGLSIGRKSVNFVITGLVHYCGYDLEGKRASDIADAWLRQVLQLSRIAQMEIEPLEPIIRRWITGCVSA